MSWEAADLSFCCPDRNRKHKLFLRVLWRQQTKGTGSEITFLLVFHEVTVGFPPLFRQSFSHLSEPSHWLKSASVRDAAFTCSSSLSTMWAGLGQVTFLILQVEPCTPTATSRYIKMFSPCRRWVPRILVSVNLILLKLLTFIHKYFLTDINQDLLSYFVVFEICFNKLPMFLLLKVLIFGCSSSTLSHSWLFYFEILALCYY